MPPANVFLPNRRLSHLVYIFTLNIPRLLEIEVLFNSSPNLYAVEFRGKDIECIGQTSRPSTEVSSTVKEVEKKNDVVKQQTPIVATAARSKPTMSITDRIVKQKEIKDNSITNEGNIKMTLAERAVEKESHNEKNRSEKDGSII